MTRKNGRAATASNATASRDKAQRSGSSAQTKAGALQSGPSRFSLLYESRDGRLCLFEDAQGHLTAVRAEKLA